MEMSSKYQIIPYHPAPQPAAIYSPEDARSDLAEHSSAGRRSALMPPASLPGYSAPSDDQKTIYSSNRRIQFIENNQVGRLINIYT
jgi:hypothetical protein